MLPLPYNRVITHNALESAMKQLITKSKLLVMISVLMLGACATGDSPTGTQEEINQIQSQLLGDMPLPTGAKDRKSTRRTPVTRSSRMPSSA